METSESLRPLIPNTNDGSRNPPRLRIDIHHGNLAGLPAYHSGPQGEEMVLRQAAQMAGYEGIQEENPEKGRGLGLRSTGYGRVNTPKEVKPLADRLQAAGCDCATLHVGWGLESDREIDALVLEILNASHERGFPLYVETHRATITQDLWRTVELTRRFPEIRFNGDFSHWYTGLELVYGDIEEKFRFMEPVFQRVRFMHGRIGTPGCIQIGIEPDQEDGQSREATYVAHFREMWTRSFQGFLETAGPGDYICFTPELLSPDIYYARLVRDERGNKVEESDRWQQALAYSRIAKDCFAKAEKRMGEKL
ncbi:MAG: PucR family transcriptional regulator ligand-binding domain-containing protein [Fibrobacterota bacterium]|nr:PucR family transcriptional regulator ligand-binding domain-containing protein [Fibrobacterota bacterium]